MKYKALTVSCLMSGVLTIAAVVVAPQRAPAQDELPVPVETAQPEAEDGDIPTEIDVPVVESPEDVDADAPEEPEESMPQDVDQPEDEPASEPAEPTEPSEETETSTDPGAEATTLIPQMG